MRRGPDSFMTIFVSGIVALGLLIYFVNNTLGPTAALVVVGGIFGAIMWMGGSVTTHATVKATMENLAEFNRADAAIDKGRMAAFRALAAGESATKKADAQIRVLDARRIDQLAQQRAKLITDNQRQIQNQSSNWDVYNDGEDDEDMEGAFVEWQ